MLELEMPTTALHTAKTTTSTKSCCNGNVDSMTAIKVLPLVPSTSSSSSTTLFPFLELEQSCPFQTQNKQQEQQQQRDDSTIITTTRKVSSKAHVVNNNKKHDCCQDDNDKNMNKRQCLRKSCLKTQKSSSSLCKNKKKNKKRVHFSTISIRHYKVVLGHHPFCSMGPPLSLGWEWIRQEQFHFYNNIQQQFKKQQQQQFIISCQERCQRLLRLGYTPTDIREAILQVNRIKKERHLSILFYNQQRQQQQQQQQQQRNHDNENVHTTSEHRDCCSSSQHKTPRVTNGWI